MSSRRSRLALTSSVLMLAVASSACSGPSDGVDASANASLEAIEAPQVSVEPPNHTPVVIGGVATVEIVSRTDVATGLASPWAMVFAPDGSLLVTQRDTTTIVRVRDGVATPLTGPGADSLAAQGDAPGEAGLLGIALLPSDPNVVYVYQTLAEGNAVLRMTLTGDMLGAPVAILDGIPAATNHDGGRIAFGPDGYLYVSTGDAANRDLPQDSLSLAGKILRIVADGTAADGAPAPGNPWGTEVWTLGHRNVQGLAWVADGRMYASEFGQSDADELNLIVAGSNYGWPTMEGLIGAPSGTALGATVDGLTYPVAEWRPTSSASPSGIAATREAVYVTGLRGTTLYRVPLTGDGVGAAQSLVTDLGRLRDVVIGPDGALYVMTNNTDGRGTPAEGDDRIVRIEIAPSR